MSCHYWCSNTDPYVCTSTNNPCLAYTSCNSCAANSGSCYCRWDLDTQQCYMLWTGHSASNYAQYTSECPITTTTTKAPVDTCCLQYSNCEDCANDEIYDCGYDTNCVWDDNNQNCVDAYIDGYPSEYTALDYFCEDPAALSAGEIAGIVIGSVCFVICICTAWCIWMGKRQNRQVAVTNKTQQQQYVVATVSNELTPREEALARLIISAELIEKCGFSVASDINKAVLLELLKRIQPSGQSSLRDAIAVGVGKMIQLKAVLTKLGVMGHQFIHIVLTDGLDTSSETTTRDIAGLYLKIGEEIGDKLFKTFFIGVGLGYKEQTELKLIADMAGDAAELHNCTDVNLSDVFERIKLSLGIHQRVAFATDGTNFVAARRNSLHLQAERQRFLVLFDLDMGTSMAGIRWKALQIALAGFFSGLDDSDIIGVELFNDRLVCLTGADLNNATA